MRISPDLLTSTFNKLDELISSMETLLQPIHPERWQLWDQQRRNLRPKIEGLSLMKAHAVPPRVEVQFDLLFADVALVHNYLTDPLPEAKIPPVILWPIEAAPTKPTPKAEPHNKNRPKKDLAGQPNATPAPGQSTRKQQRTKTSGRKTSKFKEQRWKMIQKVFGSDLSVKGRAFWEKVDAAGGMPDPHWRANGCPKKLCEAFDDPKWQRTLNTDKSRATQKLRKPLLR